MGDASSAELIAAALASVEDRIQQQIEAARARREREKQQRAELAAARNRGLGRRHAAKLRRQASRGDTTTTAGQSPKIQTNRGDTPTVADPSSARDQSDPGTRATTGEPGARLSADRAQAHAGGSGEGVNAPSIDASSNPASAAAGSSENEGARS